MNATTLPDSRTAPTVERTTAARRLLAIGAAASAVFLVGSFAQLPLNPGFDLTRHAFSFLSNGPHGWIQQTVFAVTGLLNISAGVGLARLVRGRVRVVAAGAAMLLGVGQIVSGAWPPAPSFGYPAGAPAGYPDEMTATSALHAAGFTASMISWVVLLTALAVWLYRNDRRALAAVTAVVALAELTVPAVSELPFGTVYLYVAVSVGFVLTSIVLWRISGSSRATGPARRSSAFPATERPCS